MAWFDFLLGRPAPEPEPEPEPELVAAGKEVFVAVLALRSKENSKNVGLRTAWTIGSSAEYALGYALKDMHRGWTVVERMVLRIPLAPGLEAGEAEEVPLEEEEQPNA